MIKGRIEIHEEPYAYQQPSYSNYGSFQNFETQSTLDMLLKRATSSGYIVGAKVKKIVGVERFGTIVRIHDKYMQAFNYQTGELEPFRVKFDHTPQYQLGEIDFSYDEIMLIPDFTPNSGVAAYENVSNLC